MRCALSADCYIYIRLRVDVGAACLSASRLSSKHTDRDISVLGDYVTLYLISALEVKHTRLSKD